jgi:uncharacterized RDD family membrane protein YckC
LKEEMERRLGGPNVFTADTVPRIAAYLADSIPFAALIVLSERLQSFAGAGIDTAFWSRVLVWMAVAGFVVYQAAFVRLRGATPAMGFFRLKVIRASADGNGGLSWARAIFRPLVTLASSPVLALFYALALFSHERRHVIDLIVGTRVVQSRPRPEPRRRWLIGAFFVILAVAISAIQVGSFYFLLKLAEHPGQ